MAVVTAASVEPAEDGLVLRWETDPPGTPVDISAGARPEDIDHARPLLAGVTSGEERLAPPGARHYLSVAPSAGGTALVVGERRVPLAGALNVRDLGGYATTEGRRTRWGQVFRADALSALTPEDREAIAALGLRAVFDLRRDSERERAPNVVLGGDVRSIVLAMGGAAAEGPELMDQVMAGEITSIDDDFMIEVYAELLASHAVDFGTLLGSLVEPDGLPALFHCTAGKDRTGLASAMLLSVLGVPQPVILDDYELSNRYRASVRIAQLRPVLAEAGVDVDRVLPLLSAPRAVLTAALEALRTQHGGVEQYLRGPAGMHADQLDALRTTLLD
jgi:protein-tyrosine phosphatase